MPKGRGTETAGAGSLGEATLLAALLEKQRFNRLEKGFQAESVVQTKAAGWSPASQDKKVAVAGFISKGEKPEGRGNRPVPGRASGRP